MKKFEFKLVVENDGIKAYYDQRQYLYIRTETIRERNDTFSTDDIYAGSRRSDIRRGSR